MNKSTNFTPPSVQRLVAIKLTTGKDRCAFVSYVTIDYHPVPFTHSLSPSDFFFFNIFSVVMKIVAVVVQQQPWQRLLVVLKMESSKSNLLSQS